MQIFGLADMIANVRRDSRRDLLPLGLFSGGSCSPGGLSTNMRDVPDPAAQSDNEQENRRDQAQTRQLQLGSGATGFWRKRIWMDCGRTDVLQVSRRVRGVGAESDRHFRRLFQVDP